MAVVSFRRMDEGTPADFALLEEAGRPYVAGLADRILAILRALEHGFEGYRISSLDHLLQAASRAEQDGADEEMILGALLHDIGDALAPHNHAEFAASLIRPYVRAEVYWVLRHHHVFQLYHYGHQIGVDRNMRDRFKGHRWFASCAAFCERWDQTSFDPDYQAMPLGHFEPLLHRLLARGPVAHGPAGQIPE